MPTSPSDHVLKNIERAEHVLSAAMDPIRMEVKCNDRDGQFEVEFRHSAGKWCAGSGNTLGEALANALVYVDEEWIK